PNSIPGLELLARRLVAEKKWSEAKGPLEKLIELYPGNVDADNSYLLLAAVHRELGETEAEQSVLEKLVALDADAVEANLRLAELSETAEDWERLTAAAERLLAINPLIRAPHRSLARAAGALDDRTTAISAYRALLRMDPVDPAEAHYRLARLLHREGELKAARRQTLQALEEAPRFRAAHRLLLELVDQTEVAAPAPEATDPATEQKP
ncbi:MAG: tetratricopeptide repeat protein, partial [Planctomycetes bacterium]|nr:tetratricopeptide repeat protein [Planctomycetota bacterium]